MYHEAQAAMEKLKLKKSILDQKALGHNTAAANNSTLAENSFSNSTTGTLWAILFNEGDFYQRLWSSLISNYFYHKRLEYLSSERIFLIEFFCFVNFYQPGSKVNIILSLTF